MYNIVLRREPRGSILPFRVSQFRPKTFLGQHAVAPFDVVGLSTSFTSHKHMGLCEVRVDSSNEEKLTIDVAQWEAKHNASSNSGVGRPTFRIFSFPLIR